MNYLVIVHYVRPNSTEWKTTERGFSTIEQAEFFAKEMYNSVTDEITVLIYELKKSYN